jgi:hypothetical protein
MNKRILVTLMIFSTIFMICGVFALPSGANYTHIATTTASVDNPNNHSAYAGNVTELLIYGNSVTQSWQGYFGNVTGQVFLADSSKNIMYNWSVLTAVGEVLASTNSSISWSGIKCLNFTSESEINLSRLESMFGLAPTDTDGVDETFNRNDHTNFNIGSVAFTAGQCNNTKVYGPNGAATFDETLLYETNTGSVLFSSILDDNTIGFDNRAHDFEMLVLEDGHSGDTSVTPYNFYVELV